MSSTQPTLAKATFTVGGLTLLSRVFGFIRDLLVARLFGTGLVADAYVVAFRIPNLLRSFVAEGALTAGFVPLFTDELKNGNGQSALSIVLGFLLSITTLITIIGITFAPEITLLFAPGFASNPDKLELSILLLRIMFPYIIFVSLVAMLGGALNAKHIYGQAALAQVLMNLVLILGALLAEVFSKQVGQNKLAAEWLAWSVIVGGAVQVLVQLPALSKAGLKFKPLFSYGSKIIRELVKLTIPAILGASVYQLLIFMNTVMASMLEEGSVSWLFYADRVVQLPIGVFTVALASVLLPNLSHASSNGDCQLFSKRLSDALRYTSFVILPIAGLLYALAEPITATLFERGEFTSASTAQTATAIKAYSIGLWAVSAHSMLIRGFIAKKDTLTPTLIGIINLIFTFILSLILMGPIRSNISGSMYSFISHCQSYLTTFLSLNNWDGLGAAGLALASSLSSFGTAALAAMALNRKVRALSWSGPTLSLLKAIVAALAMVITLHYLPSLRLPPIFSLAFQLATGGMVFIIVSFLLKSTEMFELRRKLLKS